MKGLLFKNLQLFAEINNMTRTSDTGISAEMKTFYDTALLKKASANLVFQQFGRKQPLPQGTGKTVEWRLAGDFQKATTPLEEGVTPDGHKLNISAITATVEQYGDYTLISDMVQKTTVDPMMQILTEKHAENAKLTIDTLIRNELATGTNVTYAPKSSGTPVTTRAGLDATCNITLPVIAKLVTLLKRVNAPKFDGSYVAVIHPDCELDLMNNEDWIDVNKYTGAVSNIFNGEIGKLYGVRFVESTEAPIFGPTATQRAGGNTDLAVYGIFFIGKGAYGTVSLEGGGLEMIIKQPNMGGSENPLNQRGSVGWKVTGFATKILIPEYLVRLECTSSEFSATAVAN